MPNLPASLPFLIFTALLVMGVWAAGLAYLDVLTPNDVKAWRRLAALRGFAIRRNVVEQWVGKTTLVDRIAKETDLSRLLSIADRSDTPLSFITQAISRGVLVAGACLALDAIARASTGDWAATPVLALVVGLVITILTFVRLRSDVQRRQQQADRTLGDMLMIVAILTEGRGMQLDDAIRLLSRCVDTQALEAIVDRGGWKRLVKIQPKTTIEQYRLVSEAYGVPMFAQLADALANTQVGFYERDTYVNLAKAVYEHRLADARAKSARAKTLITFPVAGMLVPLLILMGAPVVSSLGAALR